MESGNLPNDRAEVKPQRAFAQLYNGKFIAIFPTYQKDLVEVKIVPLSTPESEEKPAQNHQDNPLANKWAAHAAQSDAQVLKLQAANAKLVEENRELREKLEIAVKALKEIDGHDWIDGKTIQTDEANENCEIAREALQSIKGKNK